MFCEQYLSQKKEANLLLPNQIHIRQALKYNTTIST